MRQATTATYADFKHLDILFRLDPAGRGYTRVEMVANWHTPRTGIAEGARDFLPTYYRLDQVRGDGSLVFRGDTTAGAYGCPAHLTWQPAPGRRLPCGGTADQSGAAP